MPIYFYAFDFETQYAYGELMSRRKNLDGVAQGEDIILIFRPNIRIEFPYSKEELDVMEMLLNMYETFAYTG